MFPANAGVWELGKGFRWAEGPLWLADSQQLLFSDVKANTIFSYSKADGVQVYLQPSGCLSDDAHCAGLIEPGSNGLALDPVSKRVVACQHGERRVAALPPPATAGGRPDPQQPHTPIATHYQGQRLNSPNDLVFAPNGDLFFTDPSYGLNGKEQDPAREQTANRVYMVTAADVAAALRSGTPAEPVAVRMPARVTRPNGLAWAGDGRLLVANSNSSDPHWQSCSLAGGPAAAECSEFASATRFQRFGLGNPDGLTVTPRGEVIATGPGGVVVLSSDGQTLLGRVETGVKTGNVALSDDALYITADSYLLRVTLTAH